ncbi:MAG TPA: hypothetical protein VJH03_03795 [Blastocatellia bacterium]|nr:hypothetical protein [Blastocatellia bacterium]
MRRVFYGIILTALILGGCNDKSSQPDSANVNSNTSSPINFTPPATIKPAAAVDPNFKACNPYFPLVPGSQAKYTLVYSSGLIADVNVVVDATQEDGKQVFVQTTQIVDKSGGLEKVETTVRKYICDGEKVQLVFEKSDNKVADRIDVVTHKFRTDALAMLEPRNLARKGTTWGYTFSMTFESPGQLPMTPEDPVSISFTSQGEEDQTVAAGKFKVLKIERKVGQKQVWDYYARGIGLVSRVADEGTRWELKEYSGLKPMD